MSDATQYSHHWPKERDQMPEQTTTALKAELRPIATSHMRRSPEPAHG